MRHQTRGLAGNQRLSAVENASNRRHIGDAALPHIELRACCPEERGDADLATRLIRVKEEANASIARIGSWGGKSLRWDWFLG
jgi:hypothetical protein